MRHKNVIFIILIMILPLLTFIYFQKGGTLIVEGNIKGTNITVKSNTKWNQELSKAIPKKGNWSVYIKDLSTNQELAFNEHEVMQGASTLKLLTARTVEEEIDHKRFTLSTDVGGSVADHMSLMINQSNNNSWDVLNSLVTFEKMANVSGELGMENTNIFENTTSAHDIGIILTDLYSRRDSTTIKFILQNMKNTETEGRITPAFPTITVYHKSGTFDAHIHDAAIIMSDKPFILVIFSEGLSKEEAEPLIVNLSKNIFEITKKSGFGTSSFLH